MELRLSGKVAVVTGAGQGIGKAVALRLAREGADIVVAEINKETADQTAQELHALNRRALAHPVDVARPAQIQALVERAVAEFGRIEILVNAAGIAQTRPFLELTEEDWNRVLDANLKGTVFCMQAVGRQMIRQISPEVITRSPSEGSRVDGVPLSERGQDARDTRGQAGCDAQGREACDVKGRDVVIPCSYGRIVNFSSISGRRGRSLQMAYAASKAAIISVTQSAALAFSPYNINVNAVCPGVVPTPMWEQIDRDRGRLAGVGPGAAMKAFIEKVPLRRAGRPEDVAGAVAFLCSADADYITGQTLNVDGGFEMN
jgi:meso-butanediol dehydrogenase/(S,S)-butanediol dehydrogenase/diacetyl reductase